MSIQSLTRKFDRLFSMDRAEIADRVRQQARARVDYVRYKAGADFATELQSAASTPRFFFSPDAVPALCLKLRQRFPQTAEQIVQRAERICGHRFDLLGYESVDYGVDIDWHCDRVHGKRAPRKPWFRVKYLDFDEVGDSKITWELNRHQHLVTLAKAFHLSGDPRFAQEIFLQWEHWHRENPYPIGINWASSLEVAFRSLSWLWVYFLLADSAVMPTNFRAAWLRSLAISGRHIENYLSTYFSPNTHLLGEAVALFFIGTLCQEIPSAQRWQESGWEIVQQQAKRQVRDDGFHFEQSTYYHVYALDLFLHALVLASANQIAIPEELDRTVRRMLDALAVLARGGVIPRFGDDDGGRLFDPSRNQSLHMLDPLAAGAVLFGRGDFKMLARGPREETLWLLGKAGLDEFDRIAESAPNRDSVAFPASGLYVMTGNDPERQLVIDAGPQGADSAGHGHADALSITATCGGRELLMDSGTFEYVGEAAERDRYRGTAAHSTLMIAGCDQVEPKGPFSWGRLPNVQAEGWIAGKSFDLFVGSHDGYSRLPNPVVHRRFVFSLKHGFWLVRDVALGFGEYQLDLFWHIGQEFQACAEQDRLVAGNSAIKVVTVEGNNWKRNREQQPSSPVYGRQGEHSVLRFSTKTQLPAEFVTLLTPVANTDDSEQTLTRMASPVQAFAVTGYRYRTQQDEHCMFFGEGKDWKLDQWRSDAEFLYTARRGQESLQTLICCKATYVEWNGHNILRNKRAVLRCEIIGKEESELTSTDPDAVAIDGAAWNVLASNRNSELAFKLT